MFFIGLVLRGKKDSKTWVHVRMIPLGWTQKPLPTILKGGSCGFGFEVAAAMATVARFIVS